MQTWEEDWEFYASTVDETPIMIFLDLGLRTIAPDSSRPIATAIRIPLLDPNENGWTKRQETEVLQSLEESLENALEGTQILFPGRATYDGMRVIYLLYSEEERELAEQIVRSAFEKFPEYSFELETVNDPDWNCYFDFLFPSPEEMQTINNQKVLRALEKSGDELIHPREIDHWIFFRRPEDRTRFLEAVKPLGFSERSPLDDLEDHEFPYRLQIYREDFVDEQRIDETTLILYRLAKEMDAMYDGWETMVVKEKPTSSSS